MAKQRQVCGKKGTNYAKQSLKEEEGGKRRSHATNKGKKKEEKLRITKKKGTTPKLDDDVARDAASEAAAAAPDTITDSFLPNDRVATAVSSVYFACACSSIVPSTPRRIARNRRTLQATYQATD